MNSLSGYLLLAVSAGILSGIASQASHPLFRESVEGVSGIFVLLALSGPLLGFVSSPPSMSLPMPDAGELGEGEYVEVAAAALEEGIAEEIASRFSLDAGEITVECGEISIVEMRAISVSVSLTCSPAEANIPAIRRHVLENYVIEGGECDVRWSFEETGRLVCRLNGLS